MIKIKTNKTSIKSTNAIYRNNKNGKKYNKITETLPKIIAKIIKIKRI